MNEEIETHVFFIPESKRAQLGTGDFDTNTVVRLNQAAERHFAMNLLKNDALLLHYMKNTSTKDLITIKTNSKVRVDILNFTDWLFDNDPFFNAFINYVQQKSSLQKVAAMMKTATGYMKDFYAKNNKEHNYISNIKQEKLLTLIREARKAAIIKILGENHPILIRYRYSNKAAQPATNQNPPSEHPRLTNEKDSDRPLKKRGSDDFDKFINSPTLAESANTNNPTLIAEIKNLKEDLRTAGKANAKLQEQFELARNNNNNFYQVFAEAKRKHNGMRKKYVNHVEQLQKSFQTIRKANT